MDNTSHICNAQHMGDYERLGNEIVRLREERGMTRGELSKRSGVSLAELQIVETGEIEPLVNVVVALAQGLDTSPSALLRIMRGTG